MRANIPHQGVIPFVGQFPAFGSLAGQLVQIEIPQGVLLPNERVLFIRRGFTPDRPDAYVVLAGGQKTTPEQIREIYGTTQPNLPVQFLATLSSNRNVQLFPIKITYIKK